MLAGGQRTLWKTAAWRLRRRW